MTNIDKTRVIHAFRDYTSSYNPSDPKIRLKINHTYRVAGLCGRIAASVGAEQDLAWLCGMLHDIGRFEQVRRFHTFVDADSVDHAELSHALLFSDGLLSRFAPDLGEREKGLLEKAVQYHSLYRLPEDLTDEERLYCQILRDADKIDIFRVQCDTPPEQIYNVTTEALETAGVTEAVKQCFHNRTAVRRDLRRTAIDYLVGHLCLVFELVYPISREIARRQGYVDRMLSFRSRNPDTAAWFAYMRDHIWEEENSR